MSQLSLKHILLVSLAFLGVHALSLGAYFFPPLQPVIYVCLLGTAVVIVVRRQSFILFPMLVSFFLDSSGHLFEWHDISLRLAVLVVTLAAWAWHAARERTLLQKLRTPATLLIVTIAAVVLFAAMHGYRSGHLVRQVIADAIPYAYLFLFYPIRDAVHWFWSLSSDERERLYQRAFSIVIGSFVGAAILSVIVLVFFSAKYQLIHGPFYVWWRDWVAGKATYAGDGFYRIVSPLHLLLTAFVPLVVYRLLFMERDRITSRFVSWAPSILVLLILLVPTLNFSRMYFIALIPAILIMIGPFPWKKVVATLAVVVIVVLSEYVYINLAVSRGKSLASQFFIQQSEAIISTEREGSAAARSAVFPRLIEKIKVQPFFGEGLGATVTYENPFLKRTLTTPHLDWGYLEFAVEFGVPITVFFITLIVWLFWRLRTEPLAASIIVFLLVAALTTPALFHVLGITVLTALFAFAVATRYSVDASSAP